MAERRNAYEAGITAAGKGEPPPATPTWSDVGSAIVKAWRGTQQSNVERAQAAATGTATGLERLAEGTGAARAEQERKWREEAARAHTELVAFLDGKRADLEGRRVHAAGAARERIDRQLAYVETEKRLLMEEQKQLSWRQIGADIAASPVGRFVAAPLATVREGIVEGAAARARRRYEEWERQRAERRVAP